LFHALKIEFVSLHEALSVDKPFQNLYCWGSNTWCTWKCWFILWNICISNNL